MWIIHIAFTICFIVDQSSGQTITRFPGTYDMDEFPNPSKTCTAATCGGRTAGYRHCWNCCKCRCLGGSYLTGKKACDGDKVIAKGCKFNSYHAQTGYIYSIHKASRDNLKAGVPLYYCAGAKGIEDPCITVITDCKISHAESRVENNGWKRVWNSQAEMDWTFVKTKGKTDTLKWNWKECNKGKYDGLLMKLAIECKRSGNSNTTNVKSCMILKVTGNWKVGDTPSSRDKCASSNNSSSTVKESSVKPTSIKETSSYKSPQLSTEEISSVLSSFSSTTLVVPSTYKTSQLSITPFSELTVTPSASIFSNTPIVHYTSTQILRSSLQSIVTSTTSIPETRSIVQKVLTSLTSIKPTEKTSVAAETSLWTLSSTPTANLDPNHSSTKILSSNVLIISSIKGESYLLSTSTILVPSQFNLQESLLTMSSLVSNMSTPQLLTSSIMKTSGMGKNIKSPAPTQMYTISSTKPSVSTTSIKPVGEGGKTKDEKNKSSDKSGSVHILIAAFTAGYPLALFIILAVSFILWNSRRKKMSAEENHNDIANIDIPTGSEPQTGSSSTGSEPPSVVVQEPLPAQSDQEYVDVEPFQPSSQVELMAQYLQPSSFEDDESDYADPYDLLPQKHYLTQHLRLSVHGFDNDQSSAKSSFSKGSVKEKDKPSITEKRFSFLGEFFGGRKSVKRVISNDRSGQINSGFKPSDSDKSPTADINSLTSLFPEDDIPRKSSKDRLVLDSNGDFLQNGNTFNDSSQQTSISIPGALYHMFSEDNQQPPPPRYNGKRSKVKVVKTTDMVL